MPEDLVSSGQPAEISEAPAAEIEAPDPTEASTSVSLDELDPEDLDSEYELPDGDMLPREAVTKVRDRDAKNRIKRRELETQVESWGGSETVERAVGIAKALETDEGVLQLFIEAGQALGLDRKQIGELFGSATSVPDSTTDKPAADDAEPAVDDLDKPLTRRELDALEAKRESDRVHQDNVSAIHAKLDTLGVDDKAERKFILELAAQHVDDDESDKDQLLAAVDKGFADYQAKLEARTQAYLKSKADKADASPTALTGTAPVSGEVLPEPKNVDEAHARFMKSLNQG